MQNKFFKINGLYIEHSGKVLESNRQFPHVMAITLDPTKNNKIGVIRCVVSRSGDLNAHGNIDRSKLHIISSDNLENFQIKNQLNFINEKEVIESLNKAEFDLQGLEDPDIYFDDETDKLHIYFTMPFRNMNEGGKSLVCLGHAFGDKIESLEMTKPVLRRVGVTAKEVSIAPKNSSGVRYNLIESSKKEGETYYSVIRQAVSTDLGGSWKFGELIFHPKKSKHAWIKGHASPGPLLPKEFIDLGNNKLLGIMNGCGKDTKIGNSTMLADFKIGLFIYDYEVGKIDWVSPNPIIVDSQAGEKGGRGITFASHFVLTGPNEGILYAHVDDSFVRAYTIFADKIKLLLPE
jgi:hypothetical protein